VLSYPLARTFNGRGYPTLGGVPTTYVIDRKGVVRYARSGSFDAERFGEIVLPLLRESAE
jgi:peroxiredoxin